MNSPIDRTNRSCVIGAGFSGLAVAAALRRQSLAYDQLEATGELGGNWSHGVYQSTHIISSRKTTEYSDYPMPAHYPDFPSAAQMLQYLKDYAAHFNLTDNIEFNTRVQRVSAAPGELWRMTLKNGETRIYGHVIICNGHHWDQRRPQYPGQFSGQEIHSKDYKCGEIFQGKKILVVGGGNSGSDIAVEAARYGAESHISLRRGYWFLPKTIMGLPTVEYLRPWIPFFLLKLLLKWALRLTVGRYSRYGLEEPRHALFSRHPTINSQLLYALKHGTITPHKDIKKLSGNSVEFVDGTAIDVDMIVYATGYHVSLPFVDPEIIKWTNGFPDLLSGVISTHYKNFYVVGIGQPRYGAGPVLTEVASFVSSCIQTQGKLRRPVGELLSALGGRAMTSYLVDPHKSIRRARRACKIMPLLPKLEAFLDRLQGRGKIKASESSHARTSRG
jgi:hypothetical protein